MEPSSFGFCELMALIAVFRTLKLWILRFDGTYRTLKLWILKVDGTYPGDQNPKKEQTEIWWHLS
ncbi:hypothetical protein AZ46_0218585 [Metabacillus indicus LMG 22858]|nr:hypothetical protein AZ46_0218585 [Metabacillus indicus LMG 22858]